MDDISPIHRTSTRDTAYLQPTVIEVFVDLSNYKKRENNYKKFSQDALQLLKPFRHKAF